MHTHTLFEILVYYRAISFHHPTNEYLFSLNGWRYPETDSSVCDDFYQFVVLLNGLPLLERSKVSKIQKSHIIWNGFNFNFSWNMSLTNEMKWIVICRIVFLDYAKFAFRVQNPNISNFSTFNLRCVWCYFRHWTDFRKTERNVENVIKTHGYVMRCECCRAYLPHWTVLGVISMN